MPYNVDSYGNAYFPVGVYIKQLPTLDGATSVITLGPNGRLMQTSIESITGTTSPIVSVFGRTGDIVAQAGDYNTSLVTEGSNLYFTEARARAAISITNIGVNTAATYNPVTGVLNIPTYSFTPLSRTITINGVTHDLSENRSWTITPTVAVTSFNARYGDVVLTSTDVIDALGFTPVSSISETDPTVPVHVKVISTTNISNWNYAYSWGNHAVAGYLTSYTETDPIYTASSWYTTTNNSGNWNTAFSWGNHSLAGYELASNKGIAGGYAALDGGGKIPASQLPSYVDDIVEYTNIASFPATGETGKIYVALDNNKIYRWSGTAYVEITSSPGSTDAVPEGITNLYFTNTRSRNAISVSGSLSYNPTTGVISYTQPTNISAFTNDSGYITSINSTMVVSALGYTPYNSSNPAGYISLETDPTVPSHVKAITTTNISNWNTTFSWGNHAGLYYTLGSTVANSTLWNGLAIALATYTTGTVPSFLVYNSTNSRTEFGTWAHAQTWLGLGSAAYLTASTGTGGLTVAQRDSNGYLWATYLNQSSPNNEAGTISQIFYNNGGDGFLRKASIAQVQSALGLGSYAYRSSGLAELTGANFTGLVQMTYQSTINTTTPGTATYGLHFAGQTTSDYANGITWNGGVGGGAQAGIYVQGSGSYGTKMYIATTDAYVTGAKTAISIDHLGLVNFVRTRPTALGNIMLDAGNYGSYAMPIAGGTFSGKVWTASWGADVYGGAFEIRERGWVSNTQSDWSYAPAITFHWGNRFAVRLGFNYLGELSVDNNAVAMRSWVTAQGYITSAANWFGAITTGGTTDWNHISNTRPGTGYTLLLGNHSNGPGPGEYFHSFNVEYSSKDGSGNVTQFAISYGSPGDKLYMRGRYDGTWNGWKAFLTSANYTSYALPISSNLFTWNVDDTSAKLRFNVGGGGDDYIIGHSTARGFFGRPGYGWHVNSNSSFHVMSSGWVPLFGVEGDTGNIRVKGSQFMSGGLYFERGGGSFTSFIRAQNHPDQGYTGTADKYWVELGAYGGVHVTLNMDGGAGAGENSFDHFTIWQYACNSSTGSRQFYVTNAGSVWARGNITAFSDARVKENIRPIKDALSKILNSKGVMYDRIDTGEKNGIGFIAQELEQQIPDLVITDENGFKSVKYQNMVAVLVEAIKEQQKQIEELKNLLK